MRRFDFLLRRIAKMEPEQVNPSKAEAKKRINQLFEPHYLKNLIELELFDIHQAIQAEIDISGCNYDIGQIDEQIKSRQSIDIRYRMRAACMLSFAAVAIDLGEPEDSTEITQYKEYAARDLRWAEEELQTICDKCGANLNGHSWYSQEAGGMHKFCRTCIGLPEAAGPIPACIETGQRDIFPPAM